MLLDNNTATRGGFLFWGCAMLVQKGHKIQLLPNNEQKTAFRQWAGTHRWAYNYGLEHKIKAYEETGKSPGAYSLMKGIVNLKQTEEYAWLNDVSNLTILPFRCIMLQTCKKGGTLCQAKLSHNVTEMQ